MEYKGYTIVETKGYQKVARKTSTIQVREPLGESFILRKKIKFLVESLERRDRAIKRAKQFIDDITGSKKA
jgi:hypothetical protein